METPQSPVSHDRVEEIISEWDEDARSVAEKVVDKYGLPDEAAPTRLVWLDNGPWKRSVMRRKGAMHEFPAEHVDYLEQVIDYRVPPDRFDDLGWFDGSVTARRTRGELSAECHGEAANFLALNLAHEILEGEKTVEEARQAYTEIYARKEAGEEPDYIRDLQFDLPEGDQSDPDEKTLTEEMKREAQQRVQGSDD